MTDRLSEIEARLAQRPKMGGLGLPSWTDIEWLVAEVRRLEENRRGIIEIMKRADIRGDEQEERAESAEALALSLADALEDACSTLRSCRETGGIPDGQGIRDIEKWLFDPALAKIMGK